MELLLRHAAWLTAEFDQIQKAAGSDQLIVLDFHATWCGPCHAIAPVFEQLSNKYPQVKFCKVDVDQQQDLARRYQISAMPTFKFIKGGRVVEEIRGANPQALQANVQRLAGPVKPPKPAYVDKGPVEGSLLHEVSSTGLSCLGEASAHPLSSIVGPDAGPKGRSYLESDTDPELLISMRFNEAVKIKHISFFAVISPEQAPKTVKLYANRDNMDFGDVASAEPTQVLQLRPEDTKGERVELKYVKFQNVRSLVIFIEDNQGGDETTRIDSLDLFGLKVNSS